jgi:hypothetical protein
MVITKGARIGKYRLEAPLAQGGMDALWTARHVKLGNAVAVKFLAPSLAQRRSYLARFEREAHAATAIQSLHVVQVLGSPPLGRTPKSCARRVEPLLQLDAAVAPSVTSSAGSGQRGTGAPAPRPRIRLVEQARGGAARGSASAFPAR